MFGDTPPARGKGVDVEVGPIDGPSEAQAFFTAQDVMRIHKLVSGGLSEARQPKHNTSIVPAKDTDVSADVMDRWGRDVPAKYIVSCDDHNTFGGSASLRDAKVLAANPENFCDGCRGTD